MSGKGGSYVKLDGMGELIDELREVATRDINNELRRNAKTIATHTLLPAVVDAVNRSAAPQARAMAKTVRAVPDRVPVVVMGRVNPRFSVKWTRKGESGASRRLRRGSMARGVVVGPLGGRKDTPTAENYYRIPRDPSGGPLGQAMRAGGGILEEGKQAYLRAYVQVLKSHGFDSRFRG